jgi:hypothetical protein
LENNDVTIDATDYFGNNQLSQEFVAYQDLESHYNNKAISSDLNPFRLLYEIKPSEGLTISNTLNFLEHYNLMATHISFNSIENDISGGIALYNSYHTTQFEIEDILGEINSNAEENSTLDSEIKLTIENIIITGIDVVVIDEAKRIEIENDEQVIKLTQIYQEEVESNDNSISRSIFGATTYEPDSHMINVYASGDYRVFKWNGRWNTQTRLDAMHDGASPAFEPDIKMKFSTFLGIPTKGWAKPNPRSNYHSWYSNMPDAYLDTQASDFSVRSYCVGTTSAEEFNLNTTYYFQIVTKKWNSTKAKHRKLEYVLQHWGISGSVEGNPWSVGVTSSQNDTKDELFVFTLGQQSASFYSYY